MFVCLFVVKKKKEEVGNGSDYLFFYYWEHAETRGCQETVG